MKYTDRLRRPVKDEVLREQIDLILEGYDKALDDVLNIVKNSEEIDIKYDTLMYFRKKIEELR